MAKLDPTSTFLKVLRGETPPPRPLRRGSRPRITLDLDADILAYFEEGDKDALARIHGVLRAHVDDKRG